MCNKKRVFTLTDEFIEQEEKLKKFCKILHLLKNIEEDIPLTIPVGQEKQFSKTASNFHSKGKQQHNSDDLHQQAWFQYLNN